MIRTDKNCYAILIKNGNHNFPSETNNNVDKLFYGGSNDGYFKIELFEVYGIEI